MYGFTAHMPVYLFKSHVNQVETIYDSAICETILSVGHEPSSRERIVLHRGPIH